MKQAHWNKMELLDTVLGLTSPQYSMREQKCWVTSEACNF